MVTPTPTSIMFITTSLPDCCLKAYRLKHTTYNCAVDDQRTVVPFQAGTSLGFFVEEKQCTSPPPKKSRPSVGCTRDSPREQTARA